jgi:hypothetical protein
MKTIKPALFICTALVFFTAAAEAQTEAFNPSGNYHPVSPPSGDDRFVQINLRLRQKGRVLSAAGEVRNTGRWNRFATSDMNASRIRFRTATLDVVHYEFDGEFTGSGNFARQWSGKGIVMLKGSLRKYVAGRHVESLISEFVFYPLH